MSATNAEIIGGIDYANLKRHYTQNDFVTMPFSGTQDYYTVGAMAFLNNRNIFEPLKGWSLYAHGQPAAPIFFGPIPWPSGAPAFEAKRVVIRTSRAVAVRFGGIRNVQHLIPPTGIASVPWATSRAEPMEFWQRTFIIFASMVATAGTMDIHFEG